MSFTYGFYNSLNHDRKYDAIQMSSIFDGIILDGVFMTIGNRLTVSANGLDMLITVGSGRAWFDHTWNLNDAPYPLEIPEAELILKRIDAVVLEVNSEVSSRENALKIVKGTPSSNPVRPTMIHTATVNQYPLAFIDVGVGVTSIRQADVTNMVGSEETPFVTGPLEGMDIEELVAKWEDQWNAFFEAETADMEATNAYWKTQWETWFNEFVLARNNQFTDWMTESEEAFQTWFDQLQVLLDGDVAANLANAIADLNARTKELEKFSSNIQTEYSILDVLQDSNGENILDSEGESIGTRVIFMLKPNVRTA